LIVGAFGADHGCPVRPWILRVFLVDSGQISSFVGEARHGSHHCTRASATASSSYNTPPDGVNTGEMQEQVALTDLSVT
jgi:hypothetical protein